MTDGAVSVGSDQWLYYTLLGEGPNAVLIPGAHLLAADLEPLAQGRRLIFYDQRGRGASSAIKDDSLVWTDYEMRDLESIRIHFGLDLMALIGWSYLGGVAARYAIENPQRVSRLVLVCPIPPRLPAPYEDQDAMRSRAQSRVDPAEMRHLQEMEENEEDKRDPEAYCRQHVRTHFPRQMARREALAGMRSDPCRYRNEWPANLAEHWRRRFPPESMQWDLRLYLRTLAIPTLVIHGAEDLIPLESSEEWADTLPDATLTVIPGCGHFPHLEAPEIFFSTIDRFLNEQG